MNRPHEGIGGNVKHQVGSIWLKEGRWFEQTAAGAWEVPTIEIEDVTFGVRAVCGELDLPHLAGEADTEQLGALRAELKRACRDELGDLLGLDEIEMAQLFDGGLP